MIFTPTTVVAVKEILRMANEHAENFLEYCYINSGLILEDFMGEYRRPYKSKKLIKKKIIFSDVYEYDYYTDLEILKDIIRNNNRICKVDYTKTVRFIKDLVDNQGSIKILNMSIEFSVEEMSIIENLIRYDATYGKKVKITVDK